MITDTKVDPAGLGDLLASTGLTHRRLADRAGMTRSYITKLVGGRVNPSSAARSAIRQVLIDAGADVGVLDQVLPQTPPKELVNRPHALYIQHTPPETWHQVHAGTSAAGLTTRQYVVDLYESAAAAGSHPLAVVQAAIKAARRSGKPLSEWVDRQMQTQRQKT